jgi:hypothetical protein
MGQAVIRISWLPDELGVAPAADLLASSEDPAPVAHSSVGRETLQEPADVMSVGCLERLAGDGGHLVVYRPGHSSSVGMSI